MKNFFKLLILLALASCTSAPKTEEQQPAADTTQKTVAAPAASTANTVVGAWTITATISDGVKGNCRECPTINFNSDGTAIINKPKGDVVNLKWEMNGDKIKVTTAENTNPEGLFADVNYSMTFTQNKDSVKLEMVQAEKKYSYVLNR